MEDWGTVAVALVMLVILYNLNYSLVGVKKLEKLEIIKSNIEMKIECSKDLPTLPGLDSTRVILDSFRFSEDFLALTAITDYKLGLEIEKFNITLKPLPELYLTYVPDLIDEICFIEDFAYITTLPEVNAKILEIVVAGSFGTPSITISIICLFAVASSFYAFGFNNLYYYLVSFHIPFLRSAVLVNVYSFSFIIITVKIVSWIISIFS